MLTILIIQTAILLGTGVIVFFYTKVTYRLRTDAYQAQFIDALARVHQQIQSTESHQARRVLYRGFEVSLRGAVAMTPGLSKYWTKNKAGEVSGIDLMKLLLNETKDDPKTLRKFTDELANRSDGEVKGNWGDKQEKGYRGNALDRVERVITDFDIIAIPYLQDVEVMKEVAEEYRDILENTAELILPFVAIQRVLRGRPYKKPYLRLLQALGIEKNGWVAAILGREDKP